MAILALVTAAYAVTIADLVAAACIGVAAWLSGTAFVMDGQDRAVVSSLPYLALLVVLALAGATRGLLARKRSVRGPGDRPDRSA
jgi:hypothetical protein